MGTEAIDALRPRAELARRLAEVERAEAMAALRELAASLGAEAERVKRYVVRMEEARRHDPN